MLAVYEKLCASNAVVLYVFVRLFDCKKKIETNNEMIVATTVVLKKNSKCVKRERDRNLK